MPVPRDITHQPITPLREGQPPGFVVRCLECAFSVDEHGDSAEAAIQMVATRHQSGHRLIAQAVDYSTGYGTEGTDPHPLYR